MLMRVIGVVVGALGMLMRVIGMVVGALGMLMRVIGMVVLWRGERVEFEDLLGESC
jgi:hypothetical protein